MIPPMVHRYLSAAVVLLLCLSSIQPIAAQDFQSTGDPDLDARLRSLIEGSFLSVVCQVPAIQPSVCVLKRNASPNRKLIVDTFLGGDANVIGEQAVNSPLWGRGTRLKAGTIVYAKDGQGPQASSAGKVELSPAQVDLFPTGFIYQNNIPHQAVYGTTVKYNDSRPAEVSYHNVYNEEDGRKAAKELISRMLGELKLPSGCQLAESDVIQLQGERLYVYRAQPEFVTSYPIYATDAKGKTSQVGTLPVAVPILDAYVQVALDGNKMLCSFEYFWDSSISHDGQLAESLHAGEAVLKAREWLMHEYNNAPPLLSVQAIRLGFVQNRQDRSRLIPAWLFDAGSEQRVREEYKGGAGANESIMLVRRPFAVNAISGECIDL